MPMGENTNWMNKSMYEYHPVWLTSCTEGKKPWNLSLGPDMSPSHFCEWRISLLTGKSLKQYIHLSSNSSLDDWLLAEASSCATKNRLQFGYWLVSVAPAVLIITFAAWSYLTRNIVLFTSYPPPLNPTPGLDDSPYRRSLWRRFCANTSWQRKLERKRNLRNKLEKTRDRQLICPKTTLGLLPLVTSLWVIVGAHDDDFSSSDVSPVE